MLLPGIDENGHTIDRLETALWAGKIGRRNFVRLAIASGVSAIAANALAQDAAVIQQNQRALAEKLRSTYDYIVCGAGSSGSVVARRLAEDASKQVLLLEAGGADDSPSILAPLQWYLNVGSERDWGYMTEPSTALNGRSIAMPMGKALGGGSSINAMVWARGHKNDFDGWAALAKDPKWSYDHVLGITGGSRTGRGPPTRSGGERAASFGSRRRRIQARSRRRW